MLQRFNAVLLHDTLPVDLPDLWPSDILILAFVVFNPGDLYYLGYKFYNNNNRFQPVAVETHGPMDEDTISFISESGRNISEYSGDPFDSRYFVERVSVLIQPYNSILFHENENRHVAIPAWF